ncbi:MAG TPA: FkbM family methyltransferase, partial [Chitinophagaceae bacterium]
KIQFHSLFKIINNYTKRFPFPRKGWKFFRSFLKRAGLYEKPFIKKLHNGSSFFTVPAEHIQQQIFWYGYYEKEAVLTWEAFLHKHAVCLDIGANTGYYSIIAAAKAKQVYAFEPSSVNRNWLTKNIALNDLTNIHVQSFAVSNQKGNEHFYNADNSNSGMSGLSKPGNFAGSIENVETISLDEWLSANNITHVDCIKIDVEGAEMNVLQGMENRIDKLKPVIFIEVIEELLQKFGHSVPAIFNFLWDKGYKAYAVPAAKVLQLIEEPIEAYTLIFIPADHLVPDGISIKK